MSHGDRTTPHDADRYRRELYEVMGDDGRSPEEKQRDALRIGREYLDVEDCYVARVDRESGENVVLATDRESGLVSTGDVYDLSTTYCRRAVEADSPLALHDASEQGWADDPAYDAFGLACYLGVGISVDGEPYGTVCFVDRDPHPEFTPEERTFVELVARLIEHDLEREHLKRQLDRRERELDRRERELDRSAIKYRSLVETAPDAIVLADVETGEIVEANEAAADLTGYDRDDLVGMAVFDLHPQSHADRYRELFGRGPADVSSTATFPDGEPLYVETAGGEWVPIEMNASPVELDGRPYVQGIIRDVSERRERIDRLRESERKFRTIAATSFDIIFRIDRDGRFRFVSAATERTLGYDPDGLVGRRFDEILADDPDLKADAAEAFARVLDGEIVEGLVLRGRTAAGETAFLDVNATPIYEDDTRGPGGGLQSGDGPEPDGTDEERTVVGVQGVARDVTERRQREAELRVKNRAIDDAGLGIVIADATAPGNPIVYVNDRYTEMTGYDEDRLLGSNWSVLAGEATDSDAVERIQAAIGADESVTETVLNYRADGMPFWNRIAVTPVTDDSGTVTHFVSFQRDVTERKRRQRLVDVFNRILRHNLRNEMTVISGLAETIADEGDGRLAEQASVLLSAARDLSDLAETAQDLERTVDEPTDLGSRDVTEVVCSVAGDLRDTYPSTEIRVEVPDERLAVASDHLGLVLWELGDNAARHSDGPVTFRVAGDDAVRISVHDDGPGLPEQELAVLERGYETPLTHGSGLGLWIVNWLITGMGGSVSAAVDDGTTVSVTLRTPPADRDVDDSVRPVAGAADFDDRDR